MIRIALLLGLLAPAPAFAQNYWRNCHWTCYERDYSSGRCLRWHNVCGQSGYRGS